MIADSLKNSAFYLKNLPWLKKAFDFIAENALPEAQEKRYDISQDMYAVIETSKPKPLPRQMLEAHRKYADLQYIIGGYDVIGWKDLSECLNAAGEYDASKDIVFYADAPEFKLKLSAGKFALFLPHDAHAPLCGEMPVKKCIVKIKTELFRK